MGRSGNGPAVGLAAQLTLLVALLATLGTTVGLSSWGWAVALTFGVGINAAVARGLARNGGHGPKPGDLVTLTRATLACGVAGLVADSWHQESAPTALVTLAATALLLDAVDGWVARRTRTSSAFGALIDGEVDAFLIAVLSVYVAHSVGWWVLPIGAARYVFAVAGWVAPLPWLRGYLLPPRYWRKVVTATAGIVLTVAAADVLPRPLTYALLVVGLGLIAESFGRDTWWLWRRRPARAFLAAEPAEHAGPAGPVAGPPGDGSAHPADPPPPPRHRRRRLQHPAVSGAGTVLALLLVWFALVAPNQAYLVTPKAFLRIPLEGLVVAGLALVLPSWARRAMAAVVGVLLAIVTLLKLLDMGFFAAFDRPFDLATDRGYLGPAVGLARDTFGSVGGTIAVAAAAVLVLAVLVGVPLSVGRLTALVARHRSWSARTVSGLVVVCIGCALSGLQVGPGEPVASTSAGRLAAGHVRSIAADAHDQERFDEAARVDRFRHAPKRGLLSGLRGKDVTVVFVESYGRIAVKGSPTAPEVRALLDDETRRLRASGYSSASAYLTSPTFGGLSWLAHGTLQSGLWVDNQRRYDRLLSGDRLTLTRAFKRAGWRTVGILPSGGDKWPEGKRFYRFDKVYGRWDLGYQGPRFGFSKMPDQFALLAFQRLELARRHRAPVMAEIELASSHEPWAKTPRMIPWKNLGDGSVFEPMADEVEIPVPELWDDPDDVKAAYGQSIVYSLRTLFSFVRKYGDKDSVLVVVGDHQPSTAITGHGASRDVPVTIIAQDPRVLDQISGWGWQNGLRPGTQAPVWRMDAFRDRFLAAYSP